MTEECEGQITITDPAHPLFGRVLRLAGIAYLPGHARHCQGELLPGQFGYIPVACTDQSPAPRPEPTVLTRDAVAELVAAFQAIPTARRDKHGKRTQSTRVDPTSQ